MSERIEFYNAPNYEILDQIMKEMHETFLEVNCTIADIEFFMNQRVKEEIDKGNFRTTFITPSNRVAVWDCILVHADHTAKQLLMTPKWCYEGEDE